MATAGYRADCHTGREIDGRLDCFHDHGRRLVSAMPKPGASVPNSSGRAARMAIDVWRQKHPVYLSGPIFTLADQEYNLRLAEKVRALGFEVYCRTRANRSTTRNDLRSPLA